MDQFRDSMLQRGKQRSREPFSEWKVEYKQWRRGNSCTKITRRSGGFILLTVLVSPAKSKRRKNISKLQREVTLLSPRCNCARISQNENFLLPLLSQFPRSPLFHSFSFPFLPMIQRSCNPIVQKQIL